MKITRWISAYGSAASLARRLGVHPSTVQRWTREGVPQARKAALREAWESRPRPIASPSSLLRLSPSTLADRLGVTERTARKYLKEKAIPPGALRPKKRLPRLRSLQTTRPKKFASKRSTGTIEELTFPPGLTLNLETYQQIRRWFETRKSPALRGPSVRHYAVVAGEIDLFLVGGEFIGYAGRAKQIAEDEGTVELTIPSGAFRTKRAMLHDRRASSLGSKSFLQVLKHNALSQTIGLLSASYRVSKDVS